MYRSYIFCETTDFFFLFSDLSQGQDQSQGLIQGQDQDPDQGPGQDPDQDLAQDHILIQGHHYHIEEQVGQGHRPLQEGVGDQGQGQGVLHHQHCMFCIKYFKHKSRQGEFGKSFLSHLSPAELKYWCYFFWRGK